MSLDKDKVLAIQREVLNAHHVERISDTAQRINISSEQGEGYFDFHHFDDFLLGRADCFFHKETVFNNPHSQNSYGLHIALSGKMQLAFANRSQGFTVAAPEIWLSKGELGPMQATVPAKTRVRNVLIEFMPSFIEKLSLPLCDNSICSQLIQSNPQSFICLPTPSAEIIHLAWRLYHHASGKDALTLITLQGETLALIGKLLSFPSVPDIRNMPFYKMAKKAQELLESRYVEDWSTPDLAKSVGCNECDLKRSFKKLTGMTINNYLRSLRMKVALELLQEEELTLFNIAEKTGYHSKDYFVRVFRQHYGFHPENL